MKSNSTNQAPLSPTAQSDKDKSETLSPQNQYGSPKVTVKKKPKMRNHPIQTVLSPLKTTGLDQTTFSMQIQSSNELNQSLSTFRKKKALNVNNNGPMVSNYSQDLNLMMESYFSKKLKEIKTNIAQFSQKDAKENYMKINNNNSNNRFFSPKAKKDQKNPISINSKALQSESLNLSNGMKNRKDTNCKGKIMIKLQKTKNTPRDIKQKEPNNTTKQHTKDIKSTERKNKSISQDKHNRTEFNKSKPKQIKVAKNKNVKFSGAKFQYYRNDNCVHTVSLDKLSFSNMNAINKTLQDFFLFVFKRQVNVNVSFRSMSMQNELSASLRDSQVKKQDENTMPFETVPNDQSEINLNSPLLREKELNENNVMTETSLIENNNDNKGKEEDNSKLKDSGGNDDNDNKNNKKDTEIEKEDKESDSIRLYTEEDKQPLNNNEVIEKNDNKDREDQDEPVPKQIDP